MEEYRIIYPFEIEPLVYQFNCSPEEEALFIKKAFKKVQEVKTTYQQYYFAPRTVALENELFKKYGIVFGVDNGFHWSVNAEKDLAEWQAELAEIRKKNEGISYERKI